MRKRKTGWVETDKRIFAYQGDKKRSTAQETIVHKPNDRTDALSTAHIPNVLVTPKLTSMQSKFTNPISLTTPTMETSPKSKQKKYPTLISYAEGFRVSLFPSQESAEVSAILEELCSLTFAGLPKPRNLCLCCLRMLKDSSATMGGKPLK